MFVKNFLDRIKMIDTILQSDIKWDGILAFVFIAVGIGISIFNLWNNDREP